MIKTIIVFFKNITDKGFFHLLFSNLLIALSFFGAQILVAKWITPSELGLIKSWQTYISVLSVFAGLGLSAAVLKVSANKDTRDIGSYFFSSLIVLFIGAIIVWFTFLGLLNIGLFTSNQELINYLNKYSFLIILTAINALFLAHYTGQRKIKEVSKINTFYRLVSVFFIMLLTFYYGVDGFFIALVCGVALTLVVYFWLNRRELKLDLWDFDVLKRYPTVDYSFNGGLIGNGVSQLVLGLDILLLNYFAADSKMIGYYSFALLIVMGLNMFTGTVIQIVTPYITLNEDNIDVLKKQYRFYQRIAILAYVVIFILAILLTPYFSDLFFGDKYKMSENFYLPLFLFWLVKSCSAIPIAVFQGTGRLKIISKGLIFLMILNLIFYYVGYHLFNIQGIAYSMVLTSILYFLFNRYFLGKVFNEI